MSDLCPLPTQYKDINLSNHLLCIKLARLGPADPRESNVDYWTDKMIRWKVKEGEARSRLCMNCEHYDNSPENIDCVTNGPGGALKASEVDPTWADIPGMPAAVCTRYSITCSALRTCDDWEPVGGEEMEMI